MPYLVTSAIDWLSFVCGTYLWWRECAHCVGGVFPTLPLKTPPETPYSKVIHYAEAVIPRTP